jgi:hypothetical protein
MFMSDCGWEVGSTLVSQSVRLGFLIDQGTRANDSQRQPTGAGREGGMIDTRTYIV